MGVVVGIEGLTVCLAATALASAAVAISPQGFEPRSAWGAHGVHRNLTIPPSLPPFSIAPPSRRSYHHPACGCRRPSGRFRLPGFQLRIHRQYPGTARPSVTPPGALHLTRRQDLLELDLPDPDLSLYEAQPEPKDDHEAR